MNSTSEWSECTVAGDRCQQKVDACHPSPCHHSALCQLSTNHLTGYVCLCTHGYHGNHCQYCKS